MQDAGVRSRGVWWWLAAAYGAVAFIAAAYAFYRGNLSRADSEFSGLPLMLLALPWSWWFRGFRPALIRSAFNNSLLVMIGYVVLNLLLVTTFGRLAGRRRNA